MTETAWARMTAAEIRARADQGAAVILPIGSLEQHGPHLATITDTKLTETIAHRAAVLAPPTLVLPGLWLGMSEHHFPLGGTISVDFSALMANILCVARSLKVVGFARLMVANGHGGNVAPLAVAVREAAHATSIAIATCTPLLLAKDAIAPLLETQAQVMHACEVETSAMMAAAPDLVRRDLIESAYDGTHRDTARPGIERFWSFLERAGATGTVGDPRAATVEKGERIIARAAEALAAAMRDERLWTAPVKVWDAR
jgi:creatinine amidohydrolase